MSTTTTPHVGVPLIWRDDTAGYQCPYCSLWVAIPRREWATCPRCAGIDVTEAAAVLLAEHLDEEETEAAVDALRGLLDGLVAQVAGAS